MHTRHGRVKQSVFAGFACGFDAGHNAAPGTRHFFVAGSGQAHGEFVGALAAVHQVGVAIDQARRDQGVLAVVLGQWPVSVGQIGVRTHPGDGPLRDHDGRIGHSRSASTQGLRGQVQVVPDAVGAGQGCQIEIVGHGRLHCIHLIMGSFNPCFLAVATASSYPASAWRITPEPLSLTSTRAKRSAAASVPSATMTMPECCE